MGAVFASVGDACRMDVRDPYRARSCCGTRYGTLVTLALVAGCGADPTRGPAPDCAADDAHLAINEVLVLPAGRSEGRQWIELVNEGPGVAHLHGAELEVGTAWRLRRHRFVRAPELAPGATLLLGDGDPRLRAARLGLAVAYTYGALPMPPDLGELAITCGPRTLARLRYGTPGDAPAPVRGRSLARQRGEAGAPELFCNVVGPSYDGLDVGSPGASNPGCTLCRDADVWRPLRSPNRGELTLATVQADPPGPDRGREWTVVRATGAHDVDLAGLTLSAEVAGRPTRRWRLQARGCTPLGAGDTRRLAVGYRRDEPAPPLPFWLGPTLPNRTTVLRLERDDGTVVDAATVPVLPHHAGVRRLGRVCADPRP